MYLKVKVKPLSKREEITKIDEETYAIAVKEPPERNLANTRIREILSIEYNVDISKVQIINGHRSRSKIISIREN